MPAILIFFLMIPVALLIWFIVSLCLFRAAPKDSELRKRRRWMLIASSIITGTIFALIIAFMVLLSVAIANM